MAFDFYFSGDGSVYLCGMYIVPGCVIYLSIYLSICELVNEKSSAFYKK